MNSLKKQGNNCNLLAAGTRQEHAQPRKWLTWPLQAAETKYASLKAILEQGQATDGPRTGCEPEASFTWTPRKQISSEAKHLGQHMPQHAVLRGMQGQARCISLDYQQHNTKLA